ncbi:MULTISPECIES: bilirubin utilization transcriptional regulator BilQ [unclassified Adlercreutzia]|uniref:bilirubin utilization transcriptional regulator BilQ n=1 Tax=unclassified Adlercreutzia TaxID=2636013 RepID=UPI0019806326|nr:MULTISPECIES: bilirubin utilization transcriptional regulator BilQ [unclassified Adlercreutzia]
MEHTSFAFYIALLRKHFVSYCTERMRDLGITYGQLFVLIYISKNNNCSSTEIAEYLTLDAGQLHRIMAKLIDKELVTQRKNSDDRRFNVLSLTKRGMNVVEESRDLFHSWDELVLSDIDDDSRRELLDLMKNLVLKTNKKQGGKQHGQIERVYGSVDG